MMKSRVASWVQGGLQGIYADPGAAVHDGVFYTCQPTALVQDGVRYRDLSMSSSAAAIATTCTLQQRSSPTGNC